MMSPQGAASAILLAGAAVWLGSWFVYRESIKAFDKWPDVATGFFWTWLATVGLITMVATISVVT